MPSVWVHIDIREVDTEDLLEELQSRYLNDREQMMLIDLLRGEDKSKLDLFFKAKDRYSVLELQELFKEKNIVWPIPKEQLSLSI